MTARALAVLGRRRLAAAADPRAAAVARGYFKEAERVAFHGIKAPRLRAIEKTLFARVRSSWTLREAVAFGDAMLACRQLEAKALGVLLLGRFRREFDPKLLARCRRWLARNRAANWATTDALSAIVIAPLLGRFPAEVKNIERWTRDRSLWVRRAAAVSLTPLARRGTALAAAYRVAEALLADPHDLIHKASGWLLREAGRTDAPRLEGFLLRYGPRIPRTAVRYAIERLAPADRKRVLAATRAERAR
jgi:3-methyladenine DNA glycosylase AlkD